MRIGIITFQETNNYGALWQNYALQRALEKAGANVQTIDYRSKYIAKPYRFRHLLRKGIFGYLFGLAGYICYLFRTKKNGNFRKNICYSCPVDAQGLAELNGRYDKFIAGSDQVWNCRLTDYDDAYGLGFVEDSSKKTSYAASLGRKEPGEPEKAWYVKQLSDYQEILVREKSAEHILRDLLGKDVGTVLDPVFLLGRNEWKKAAGTRRLVKERYILVYQLGISKALVSFAADCADYFRCRLVFLPFPLVGLVRCSCRITAGAGEALNYIQHAEYVITDSFHGTALSVIFQKKFLTLAAGTHRGVNSRILDLLAVFGLQERIWKKTMAPYDLDREIDWEAVCRIWKEERRKSYMYVKKIAGE